MENILKKLSISSENYGSCIGGQGWIQTSTEGQIESRNPSNNNIISTVYKCSEDDYEKVISASTEAFEEWRKVPAPIRGQLIFEMGNELRANKDALGSLVSLEMGKIKAEGDGEVQEMIDIADFAVGLSRQLYGLTMHSERPDHRMYEQWHPLGNVGIISAFNFPVAGWAWNSFIAAVCGNISIWKPSSKTPLTAVAVQNICNNVLQRNGYKGIFNLVIGSGSVIGEKMVNDKRVPLISATGSTRMGIDIAQKVAKRLGKSILELGGNNAIIVDETASMDLGVPAIVFGAVGTAGQRCSSTRRIIAHKSIFNDLNDKLVSAYKQVRIGDPLKDDTLMGPLIDASAVSDYSKAIQAAVSEGGEVLCGGKVLDFNSGSYVEPTIIKVKSNFNIIKEETFAPILYVME